MQTSSGGSTLKQIPAGIWILGLASMLMDISSEVIHSLLPMFMVTTLGAQCVKAKKYLARAAFALITLALHA